MGKLDAIKKYCELLSKAAKWHNSGEQILEIESVKNSDKKKEYIYELYCFLRVIDDLSASFSIEITNTGMKPVFPKAPASKKNYPYFLVKDKVSGQHVFEICTSIDIKGLANETSAPDISFLLPTNNFTPGYKDVIMLFDAKFKHALSTGVYESEFNKVAAMVTNLDTKDTTQHTIVKLNKLQSLIGNCLLTNSNAFKNNHAHHKIFGIKEVEKFDVGVDFNVIG